MLHLFAAFFALIFCFGVSSQPARPQPAAVPAVVDCSFTTPRGPNSPTLEQVSFGNSSYPDTACPSSPATSVSFTAR